MGIRIKFGIDHQSSKHRIIVGRVQPAYFIARGLHPPYESGKVSLMVHSVFAAKAAPS